MDEIVRQLDEDKQFPAEDVIAFLNRATCRLRDWDSGGRSPSTLHPAWALLGRPMPIEDLLKFPADEDHDWQLVESLGFGGSVPPEYLKNSCWDVRSAIYSLGCAAWMLLVGRSPFSGNSVIETMTRRLDQPIDSPCNILSDCPASLGRIIERATAIDPNNRYQSPNELLSDLSKLEILP